jgi:hypothetical protein
MGRRKRNVTWSIDPGPGGWWVCGVGYVKDSDDGPFPECFAKHRFQTWKNYRTASKATDAFANLIMQGFRPLMTKEYWHNGVRYAREYGFREGDSPEWCAKLVRLAKKHLEGRA